MGKKCRVAQVLAPEPRIGLTVVQPEHVAGHGTRRCTIERHPLEIAAHPLRYIRARRRRRDLVEDVRVDRGKQIGIVVSGAAEHDAIDVFELGARLDKRRHSAVQDERR